MRLPRTWGHAPPRYRPPLAAVLAASLFWGLLLAFTLPLAGQVTTEATLDAQGYGRVLVRNPGASERHVSVTLWESDEGETVELIRQVPGAVVFPDSFRLPSHTQQTVRVAVPVDSLGYAPGRVLRVRTIFVPVPPGDREPEAAGVVTRLREVVRYVTVLRVASR